MTSKKRKLPSVGIFDPNYSQDPQYGNVSTLENGLKRIHLHYEGQSIAGDSTVYVRFIIRFPECEVPRIDYRKVDSVENIKIPVIKNFDMNFSSPNLAQDPGSVASFWGGLFENDEFSGKFPLFDNPGVEAATKDQLNFDNAEAFFILNHPIAYHGLDRGRDCRVSNMNQRGYILLQNFVVMLIAFKGFDTNNYAYNAYIDYDTCDMKYRDALIWKADYEQFITDRLKYRINVVDDKICCISRGTTQWRGALDPTTFPAVKTDSDLYRVATRDVETAGLSDEEFAWSRAVKKYMGKDESSSS